MRKELFHMERDVLNIGDSVTIIEGQLPFSYVSKERKGSTFEIYVEFEN